MSAMDHGYIRTHAIGWKVRTLPEMRAVRGAEAEAHSMVVYTCSHLLMAALLRLLAGMDFWMHVDRGMDSWMHVDTPVTTFEAFRWPNVSAPHMQCVCVFVQKCRTSKNQIINFGNFTHAFKTAIF